MSLSSADQMYIFEQVRQYTSDPPHTTTTTHTHTHTAALAAGLKAIIRRQTVQITGSLTAHYEDEAEPTMAAERRQVNHSLQPARCLHAGVPRLPCPEASQPSRDMEMASRSVRGFVGE